MRRTIKRLFHPLYSKYHGLLTRVSDLEIVLDTLVESPTWTHGESIGFNGQRHRKAIFSELTRAFAFDAIVETGTFIGNTTGYLATTSGLPVHTCDAKRRFSAVARRRLDAIPNITFTVGDSRPFLRSLAATELSKQRVFFYLDAHWQEDLPLAEEIETIATHWREYVIMIDDFKVEGDAGYSHDDYGTGKALSLADFGAIISARSLVPFFPSGRSSDESGGRAGSVVLAPRGAQADVVASLGSLRRADQ